MKYEELKIQITEIVAICKELPEEFRAQCFQMLLDAAIRQNKEPESTARTTERKERQEEPENAQREQPTKLAIPGHVRAFLRRQEVTDSSLEELVMVDGATLHWLKEPAHRNVRKGQNEWALLLALKNALLGNTTLSVDPEEVRSTAQNKGFYDKGNFAGNFKKDPYQTWYRGEMVPQGAAQVLSKEGEVALAELIKRLAST